MRKLSDILLFLTSLLLFSCSKEDDNVLVFVGDSLVQYWDTNKSFAGYSTINKGVIGYGIKNCINENYPTKDNIAILFIGTNDMNSSLKDDEISKLVNDYINLALSLEARKVLCISLLPREIDVDGVIDKFNQELKSRLGSYSNLNYVDVHDIFMGDDGTLKKEYASDEIHINELGYEILSYQIRKKL